MGFARTASRRAVFVRTQLAPPDTGTLPHRHPSTPGKMTSYVLGIPLVLALVSLQVECRIPPKFIMMDIEKALYGGDKGFAGRLGVDPGLSRKEAYRGRRRRKRRPASNYIHSYGYYKKARGRPRRPPPPVQEYSDDFEEPGEEPGYSEERLVRTRPWSNHLYSASIRMKEPSRVRPELYNPRYRGKKPRPLPIGGGYVTREPDEFDTRSNDYRDEFYIRGPEWEFDEPTWDSDGVRNPTREDFKKFNGKHSPWRDNREVLRVQNFKHPVWNTAETREITKTQPPPPYRGWNGDTLQQDDIEVQVKYPVWMEEGKPENRPTNLFPGQRPGKQKYLPDDNVRHSNRRPALNQDLESHVLQPSKKKTKFRSGIGQNIRGQNKENNWEPESPFQGKKVADPNWEEPKPFDNSNPHWTEPEAPKNFGWNQKKTIIGGKDALWDEPKDLYNKDFPWSETSSTSSLEYWTDRTTSTSQAYPHWDNSQPYYHDRSLRQQAAAQPKIGAEEEEHDSDSQHKPIGTNK